MSKCKRSKKNSVYSKEKSFVEFSFKRNEYLVSKDMVYDKWIILIYTVYIYSFKVTKMKQIIHEVKFYWEHNILLLN